MNRALVITGLALLIVGCKGSGKATPTSTLTKMEKVDVVVGKGPDAAKKGDLIFMEYTGTHVDGSEFDSNVGKDPFSFILGTGAVIKGWDEGLVGMRAGGERTLKIPASMAYGETGQPPKIGPNEDLNFKVKCLYVLPPEGQDRLDYEDRAPGSGPEIKKGSKVTVHYTGKLINGKVFDSTYEAKKPITFTVGKNEVIRGWEEGILGMRKGGKRHLVIPPGLAYGQFGKGERIPGNAVLDFEIEVLDVK
jgi:FKBP-type peptidyl-prolyl cis-trans isomerase